jgi:dCTP deaminase
MQTTTFETQAGPSDQGRTVPGEAPGVFSSQSLREAIETGWIDSDFNLRGTERLQAASLDLTLGPQAWRLRCSFLPDGASTVEAKLHDLAFDPIDLRDGALLERNRPYLIPLAERLRLPGHVRGRTNPKSSTGRLDVFTRVITDQNNRFDEIRPGYEGSLYLEVVPRSFAIRVKSGLALNQLRLIAGDPALRDDDLRTGPDNEFPLLLVDGAPVTRDELPLANGLFLSLDLRYHEQRPIGFRAKSTSRPVDMSRLRHYDWHEYWEPVMPEPAGRFVLEPEQFYLLLSREGVCIPPTLAAEMAAYDPTAGELRTHYAGFFDPGFGYDPAGARQGSRAALEVRAHDVPFMVEDGQPVCKLTFERLDRVPDSLYGEGSTSHYQGQETMLSKHFADQTAGVTDPG